MVARTRVYYHGTTLARALNMRRTGIEPRSWGGRRVYLTTDEEQAWGHADMAAEVAFEDGLSETAIPAVVTVRVVGATYCDPDAGGDEMEPEEKRGHSQRFIRRGIPPEDILNVEVASLEKRRRAECHFALTHGRLSGLSAT